MSWIARYFGVVAFAMILTTQQAQAGSIGDLTDGTSNTLVVSYTAGSVVQGPLSYGLLSLPTEVSATFSLGTGFFGNFGFEYDLNDVTAAQVAFGDGLWTQLTSFDMTIQNEVVTSLSYQFAPIQTLTTNPGGIVLNFPLSITGTDAATGQAFEYQYTVASFDVLAPEPGDVPEPGMIFLLSFGLLGLIASNLASRNM